MPSRLKGALGPVGPLPEQLEQWRQRLLRQLPGPLHGVRTLFVGDPLKVIITFEDDRVEVFLPQVEWPLPNVPRQKPQLQGCIALADGSFDALLALIEQTIHRRVQSFRECSCCGRRMPPEMMGSVSGQATCRRCIEGRRLLL
ncbi:hypothetical protein [Pseudaeromonas paramecii]|uniref:DksA C4-type domain-containing protein n=1 Tax=Pseudaeromonas paramecii TaxID=2138166 RepID=A0ABP8QBG4_9GAMM